MCTANKLLPIYSYILTAQRFCPRNGVLSLIIASWKFILSNDALPKTEVNFINFLLKQN